MPAPLERIPVWVRAGSIVVTYPAAHVAAGLGDTPESERPLVATLWGKPRLGRAAARLADGTRVAWHRAVGRRRPIATSSSAWPVIRASLSRGRPWTMPLLAVRRATAADGSYTSTCSAVFGNAM